MPTSPLDDLLRPLADRPRDAELELEFELRQQAGVTVVVRPGTPADLLFIKRAHNPRDPWSGHIALPGGRREPADRDLVETAIRETHEETGIRLPRTDLVARLPEVAPRGPAIPKIVVVPFLFTVEGAPSLRLSPGEVERTRWVSLGRLRDPEYRAPFEVVLPAGRRTFPSIRIGDDVIWGMTFRIVEDLLILLDR